MHNLASWTPFSEVFTEGTAIWGPQNSPLFSVLDHQIAKKKVSKKMMCFVLKSFEKRVSAIEGELSYVSKR